METKREWTRWERHADGSFSRDRIWSRESGEPEPSWRDKHQRLHSDYLNALEDEVAQLRAERDAYEASARGESVGSWPKWYADLKAENASLRELAGLAIRVAQRCYQFFDVGNFECEHGFSLERCPNDNCEEATLWRDYDAIQKKREGPLPPYLDALSRASRGEISPERAAIIDHNEAHDFDKREG